MATRVVTRAAVSTVVMVVLAACAGTDTGNPFEDLGGGRMGIAGGGGDPGVAGGAGTAVGGGPPPRPDGGSQVPRRRCDDGTIPALPSTAACGGSCNAGWFCCSALDEPPSCVHESHPCYRMQLCADPDAGVVVDAAVVNDAAVSADGSVVGSDAGPAGDDDAGDDDAG